MTNLQNLILSIREDIPDRVEGDDAHLDGRAFSLATILRWINEAGDLITHNANVIQDWYAIPAVVGQDVYELPEMITSVDQVWYNLLPLDASSEGDNMFTVKRSGSAWWFSPHTTNIIPRLFIYPAPSEAGAATQLDGAVNATATTFTVDDSTGFNQYGMVKVDDELARYATVGSATELTNLIRGHGSTTAAAHSDNAVVTDCNILMKVFRMHRQVEDADSQLEIPRGLHPLIQLWCAAKVVSGEQDKQAAAQLRQEFFGAIDKMSAKSATRGLRQGIQVKTWPDGGTQANVRVYFP